MASAHLHGDGAALDADALDQAEGDDVAAEAGVADGLEGFEDLGFGNGGHREENFLGGETLGSWRRASQGATTERVMRGDFDGHRIRINADAERRHQPVALCALTSGMLGR